MSACFCFAVLIIICYNRNVDFIMDIIDGNGIKRGYLMKFSLRAMKARIISLVAVLITLLTTAGCIWFNYYSIFVANEESRIPSAEFTVDVFNALIIFAMGYVFTAAQNIKHNNYYYLKKLYKELCGINALFTVSKANPADDNSVRAFIISFRVLTARTDEMIETGVAPHYILENLKIKKSY